MELIEITGRALARVDHETVLASLLTLNLISAWFEQSENFGVIILRLRLELRRPVLEDLPVRTAVTLDILSVEDGFECQMR